MNDKIGFDDVIKTINQINTEKSNKSTKKNQILRILEYCYSNKFVYIKNGFIYLKSDNWTKDTIKSFAQFINEFNNYCVLPFITNLKSDTLIDDYIELKKDDNYFYEAILCKHYIKDDEDDIIDIENLKTNLELNDNLDSLIPYLLTRELKNNAENRYFRKLLKPNKINYFNMEKYMKNIILILITKKQMPPNFVFDVEINLINFIETKNRHFYNFFIFFMLYFAPDLEQIPDRYYIIVDEDEKVMKIIYNKEYVGLKIPVSILPDLEFELDCYLRKIEFLKSSIFSIINENINSISLKENKILFLNYKNS